MSDENPSTGEFILYTSDDGKSRIECRFENETMWLSQALMADLFDRDVRTINEHLLNLYDEAELDKKSTIRNFRIVRQEGSRQVKRNIEHYNLEAILAVGFRVKSPRGTQFRKWANSYLQEFLTKGFIMDDERMKNPGGWDYFDELLERIREIRASEKRFYQKVRDLFALSSDYQTSKKETNLFFAEVQNKLIYAVTSHTAAELIVNRADSDQPNMALNTWSGSRVRKQDVIVAKNYLNADEVDTLNRLVVIFLEQAELRLKQKQDLTLAYWRRHTDLMLELNGQPILENSGSVSRDQMKSITEERYQSFHENRKLDEAKQADIDDLKQLEELEQQLKNGGNADE